MLTIPANDTVVKIGKLQDYFSCARINGRSIGSCLIVFWPRAGLLGLTARLEGRESNIRNLLVRDLLPPLGTKCVEKRREV